MESKVRIDFNSSRLSLIRTGEIPPVFMFIVLPESPSVKDCISAVADVLQQNELFFGHGTDNAADEAFVLIRFVLGAVDADPVDVLQSTLDANQVESLQALVQQRIDTRKPAAYLTGEAWFAGLRFFVNEHVLVPRSPFAELIQEQFQPWVDSEQTHRILDLCTGSGCIAIACAAAFPEAKVDALDLSPAALAVARRNVERHGLQQRVQLFEGDLFAGVSGQTYDLIVSNPPYVSEDELEALPDEYQAEPAMGFAGGLDGLDLVHRILVDAADHLTDRGVIYIEVGSSAETLLQTYPQVDFLWQDFECGGDGVFMLTRQQLVQHASEFQAHLND